MLIRGHRRLQKWAGRWFAYDEQQQRYRQITGLVKSPGIRGRLRDLWARIKMEEGL